MAGGNKQVYAKLKGNILSFPVKIATAIYRGTAVAIDAAGYLVEASDAAAMKFVGIAEEACTVAEAVADGTISIRVRRHGIFRMTKNTTSAVTDVGKLAYAHTAQTASVDELVALIGTTTYDNAVGLIVRREPDTPGGSAFTNNWLMVDITPAPWSATDVTTHAALADQTAHVAAGVGPSLTAESSGTPTITAAEFYGGLINCTNAGAVSFALPASGVVAGTQCRIVKANATAGALTITATTLVGPGCTDGTTGNEFNGCPNDGDSVVIENVGADSYRIVAVNQQVAVNAVDTDTAVTAAEFMSGYVTCGKGSAQAITLPADSVPVGTKCIFKRLAHASAVTISATALDGGASSGNDHAACDAIGDSVIIVCNACNDYTVIAESIA